VLVAYPARMATVDRLTRAHFPTLVAVSVGGPRDVEWQGRPLRTSIFKTPVAGPIEANRLGLEGDSQSDLSVHGGVDKAVYAYDESSTAYWRERLARPDLGPGAFGENFTFSGLPDAEVFIGDRLRIGTACFEVSQPRQPCLKLARLFEDASFPKQFLASLRGGYYLRVVEPGRVTAGDPVVRIPVGEPRLAIPELVEIMLGREPSEAVLARAVSLEALADAWRIPLRERLEAARS